MASQNITVGTAIRWRRNTLSFAGILKIPCRSQTRRIPSGKLHKDFIQEGCGLLFYFFSKKRYILFFFGILNVSNEIAEDGLKTEANKNICIKKGEVKWDLN